MRPNEISEDALLEISRAQRMAWGASRPSFDPGRWAEYLATAEGARNAARQEANPMRRRGHIGTARFYVRLAKTYPNPRLPS